MERYYHKVSSKRPKPSSTTPDSIDLGEKINESEQHRQNEGIDLSSLPTDPGERLAIRKYHPNDYDAIRRSYIHQGPFQPRKHLFPKRYVYGKCRAKGYLKACLTFEVVFMLHFMRTILAITNELNAAFQKKEQDIANAMLLVGVAKERLQKLREEGWDSLIDEVSKFCIKYDISIPKFDEFYVILGRSRRRVAEYTVLHHYQVAIFYKIIDWQHQELNNRFDEEITDLLLGIACLNPADSFSSFNIEKILRLAELYPDDFDEHARIDLRFQLENYIVDVRDHDKRFSDLKGLCDFSKKLVETKKHGTYPLVFRLVKFALLLPVATATVERAFSVMKLIKTDLRNRMDDELLSGCLVPYMEKEVFSAISNENIWIPFKR